MLFTKALVILILIGIAMVFLALGLGVTVPSVEYKGVTARDVPVGLAFLVAAVLTATFWKIQKTVETTTTEQTSKPDGSASTATTKKTTIRYMAK